MEQNGEWKSVWTSHIRKHRDKLDMSSVDLDGCHTRTTKDGESVGYQGRKKSNTTNALYLTDRQGIPVAMSEPIYGEPHDSYKIEKSMSSIFETLREADIYVDGLFLNAEARFCSKGFRRWSGYSVTR